MPAHPPQRGPVQRIDQRVRAAGSIWALLDTLSPHFTAAPSLGAWGRNNQVPRGARFKAALDTLFGGDCPAHCSGTRERFQSCDRCPKISNPQIIAAFRDMEVPDEAQLEAQALPLALPEHAIATQAVPTEAGGTGTN